MLAVTLALSVPVAQAEGRLSERDIGVGSSVVAGGLRELGSPSDDPAKRATSSRSEKCPAARRALRWYQRHEREWRVKMGAQGKPVKAARATAECPRLRYLAQRWRDKARAARARFASWHDATYEKWLCIHEHEGAWNDDDPPYWGGLQFSDWFQRHYGPEFFARWGTADRWPVWSQLVAAERAWRECVCFRQWGTAWRCGLS